MSRKQEFDPLGGFVGGGVDRRSRKSKKTFDVLGSGKYGDSGSIFDEGSYEPADVTGYSDALLATGSSDSASKPAKHGLFGGLFKKKQKQSSVQESASQAVQDPGFDSRGYELDIKDGVMDTGLISRYKEEENVPVFDSEPAEEMKPEAAVPCADTELFSEDVPQNIEEKCDVSEQNDTVSAENTAADLFTEHVVEEKPAVSVPLNPHVCHLCGRVSQDELPEFGFNPDEFVPLCKICTRAVNTLMKHTDPAEEVEIYEEWSTICPGLNEKRAKELIKIGRGSS